MFMIMATSCCSISNIGESFPPAGWNTRGFFWNKHVRIVDLLTCTLGNLSFVLNVSMILSSLCLENFPIFLAAYFLFQWKNVILFIIAIVAASNLSLKRFVLPFGSRPFYVWLLVVEVKVEVDVEVKEEIEY